ncbi:hypothetical protein D5S19_24530 [Amycolatopsis panacis]|uniref:Uncharacterized protein n=1 Tax=Amycolatopsis panacis TaxID=2340917 RepID=A0A419HV38_9PSEU|nr:hypothetical protein D5S19_24530 [Amycolatopsis panacis]
MRSAALRLPASTTCNAMSVSANSASTSANGSAVGPPLACPHTSGRNASNALPPSEAPPAALAPPAWHITVSPASRAQRTWSTPPIGSANAPKPYLARLTPVSASSRKSCSDSVGSISTAPARTRMPPGRYLLKHRCAAIASAFTPAASRGRPGTCTSPADTVVVMPPWT